MKYADCSIVASASLLPASVNVLKVYKERGKGTPTDANASKKSVIARGRALIGDTAINWGLNNRKVASTCSRKAE